MLCSIAAVIHVPGPDSRFDHHMDDENGNNASGRPVRAGPHQRPEARPAQRLLPPAARPAFPDLARVWAVAAFVAAIFNWVRRWSGARRTGTAWLPRPLRPLRDPRLRLPQPGRRALPRLRRQARLPDRRGDRPAGAAEPLDRRLPPRPRGAGPVPRRRPSPAAATAYDLVNLGRSNGSTASASSPSPPPSAGLRDRPRAHAARSARPGRLRALLRRPALGLPAGPHRPLPLQRPADRVRTAADPRRPGADGGRRRGAAQPADRLLPPALAVPAPRLALALGSPGAVRRDRQLVRDAGDRDRAANLCTASSPPTCATNSTSAPSSTWSATRSRASPGPRTLTRSSCASPRAPPEPLASLFRLPLALPAMLLAAAYGSLLFVVAVLGWFAALFTGRMPLGLRNAGALALRYSAQLYGYLFLVTEAYPYSGPCVEAAPPRSRRPPPLQPLSVSTMRQPMPRAARLALVALTLALAATLLDLGGERALDLRLPWSRRPFACPTSTPTGFFSAAFLERSASYERFLYDRRPVRHGGAADHARPLRAAGRQPDARVGGGARRHRDAAWDARLRHRLAGRGSLRAGQRLVGATPRRLASGLRRVADRQLPRTRLDLPLPGAGAGGGNGPGRRPAALVVGGRRARSSPDSPCSSPSSAPT